MEENILSVLERGRLINALRVKKHFLQQLFWECTLRCNLNCRHCGSSCTANDRRKDMPLDDLLPVLEEIKQKTTYPILVITTGGEPLLRKDICQCGKEITRRGYYWGMVTNGMLLDERMFANLLEAGLSSLSVSIDGLREEHNWMRRNEKSFDNAIRAVDIIVKTPSNLTWDVITCVNKRNVTGLKALKDTLIAHGVRKWKIFTVFPMGRADDDDEMQLTKEQYHWLMQFIADTRKSNTITVSYGCEGFLGPYEYKVRDNQYFCAAGVNVASIRYDGSISGCLSVRYDYKEGDIYKDSFMDVWNNRFSQFRDMTWKKTGACKECKAWRWCEGNGMHLRDDNGRLLLCNYRRIMNKE